MIAALLGRLGLLAGVKSGGWMIALALAAGLFAAGGLGFWRGMAVIERQVETARREAIAGRDAHWRAEIERSNAAAERQRAEAEAAVARASAEAEQRIAGLHAALAELEKRNETLPNSAACGLGPERARELNRLRGH